MSLNTIWGSVRLSVGRSIRRLEGRSVNCFFLDASSHFYMSVLNVLDAFNVLDILKDSSLFRRSLFSRSGYLDPTQNYKRGRISAASSDADPSWDVRSLSHLAHCYRPRNRLGLTSLLHGRKCYEWPGMARFRQGCLSTAWKIRFGHIINLDSALYCMDENATNDQVWPSGLAI